MAESAAREKIVGALVLSHSIALMKQTSRSPLRRSQYRAAARCIRQYADAIEQRSAPLTPRELAALTSAIHGLSRYAPSLSPRHRARKHFANSECSDHEQ